ncbi:MAG: hypothetical protein GY811_26315 [Myxococcales bacterium]|nr:hypothetical protein [Myxococcales bacterium]
MRIAAISDLHIGSTKQTDCFRHGVGEFLSFLDMLEANHDRIVLLGDIFQSEYGAWIGPRTAQRQLALAQARTPALWERFQDERYVYLHGNHDEASRQASGARMDLRVSEDGFAVYFIHGHQYDPLLRNFYPLARASTWLSGRVRRAGLRSVADWLEHQDVSIKHRKFQGAGGPYASGAERLLLEQAADVVVMGHTHVQRRLKVGGGIYANTGTCSHGQRMYVSVDTAARNVACLRG